MSSICPGLGLRRPSRPMSHLVDRQPVAAVADSLSARPAALALLRRIDGIRGDCDPDIDRDPAMRDLKSRQLVRFYSGYKSKRGTVRRHQVFVLSKGDMVLDELDRRARKDEVSDTMIRLVESGMDRVVAEMDALAPPVTRSRLAAAHARNRAIRAGD